MNRERQRTWIDGLIGHTRPKIELCPAGDRALHTSATSCFSQAIAIPDWYDSTA